MDKKIVERLVDMGLIEFVGVDCDKFKTADDLIDSGLITATIDRARLYEIIGVTAPTVEEAPTIEETPTDDTDSVDIIEEVIVKEVDEVDVPADAEIVEEIVIDEVPVEEVVEETPVVTPKKKSNKKAE